MAARVRMNAASPRGSGAILAFDCAGAACSAVVWRAGRVLARRAQARLHGQAEVLLPMIQAALADAGMDFAGLAAVATTLGPGSFTGLRAGLAAARGLALATGLPAVGVSTLEAAAHAVPKNEGRARHVVAAVDSRRDEIFVQFFDSGLTALGEPLVQAPRAAAASAPAGALVLTGDAASPLAAAFEPARRDVAISSAAGATDAAVVAALADARLRAGAPLAALRPLYLRAPDITPQPAAKP